MNKKEIIKIIEEEVGFFDINTAWDEEYIDVKDWKSLDIIIEQLKIRKEQYEWRRKKLKEIATKWSEKNSKIVLDNTIIQRSRFSNKNFIFLGDNHIINNCVFAQKCNFI